MIFIDEKNNLIQMSRYRLTNEVTEGIVVLKCKSQKQKMTKSSIRAKGRMQRKTVKVWSFTKPPLDPPSLVFFYGNKIDHHLFWKLHL